jgi:hypothetical protein
MQVDDRVALPRLPLTSSDGFGNEDGGFLNKVENGGGLFPSHDGGPLPSNGDADANHRNIDAPKSVFGLTRSLPSSFRLMTRLGNILAVSSSAVFLLVVFPLLCRSALRVRPILT